MIPCLAERKRIGEEHLKEVCTHTVQIQKMFGSFSLFVDGFNWMNTNDIDLNDHSCIFEMHGRVLFTGLGLGLAAKFALSNPAIEEIVVVEKDRRIIETILPMLEPFDSSQRLLIICRDADSFQFYQDFDFAFLDHYKAEIPRKVKDYYCSKIPNVICWFEEVQKWL